MFNAAEDPIIFAKVACLFIEFSKLENGVPIKIIKEDQINI